VTQQCDFRWWKLTHIYDARRKRYPLQGLHRPSLYRGIALSPSLYDTLRKSQRIAPSSSGAFYAQCYARSIDPHFLVSQSWFTTAPGARTSERTLLSENYYYPGKRRMNYDAQAFRTHECACIIITSESVTDENLVLLIVSRHMHFHTWKGTNDLAIMKLLFVVRERKQKRRVIIKYMKRSETVTSLLHGTSYFLMFHQEKRPSCQCLSTLRKIEIKSHQSRTRIISAESCALGLNFMKY